MVAMTSDGLGISIGAGMEDDMVGALKNAPVGVTPLFSFVYDMRRIGEAIQKALPPGSMGESEEMTMSVLKMYERFGMATFDVELREEGTFVRTKLQLAY
jgi:hypothetical protein